MVVQEASDYFIDSILDECEENAREILEKGLDLNKRDYNGMTPLDCGVYYNHYGITKLLLEYGANPNDNDKDGNTSLSLTVRSDGDINEKVAMLELLLKNGADPTIVNNDGTTLVSYIEEKYREESSESINIVNKYLKFWKSKPSAPKRRGVPDINFIIRDDSGGQTVNNANKNALTKDSEYFKSLFSGKWGTPDDVLEVEGFSWAYPEAFQAILDFLETGYIGDIDSQTALDILPATNYYNLPDMFDLQVAKVLLPNLEDEGVEEYIKESFTNKDHWWYEMFNLHKPVRKSNMEIGNRTQQRSLSSSSFESDL